MRGGRFSRGPLYQSIVKRLFALFALMLGLLAVTSPAEARVYAGSAVSEGAARETGADDASGIQASLRALSSSALASRVTVTQTQKRRQPVRTVMLPTVMMSDCPRE